MSSGAFSRPGDHRDARRPDRAANGSGAGGRQDRPTGRATPLGRRSSRCSTAAPGSGAAGTRGGTWLLLGLLVPARRRWCGLRSRSSWPSRPSSIHLLAAARGLRLPAGKRAGVRAARPRPGVPVRAGDRPVGLGAPAYRRAGRRHRRARRPVRRLGAARCGPAGRPRGLLVPLPARLPGLGRSRTLYVGAFLVSPTSSCWEPGLHLGLADPRPDRADDDRQPAVRRRRRLRLVRPGRIVAAPALYAATTRLPHRSPWHSLNVIHRRCAWRRRPARPPFTESHVKQVGRHRARLPRHARYLPACHTWSTRPITAQGVFDGTPVGEHTPQHVLGSRPRPGRLAAGAGPPGPAADALAAHRRPDVGRRGGPGARA